MTRKHNIDALEFQYQEGGVVYTKRRGDARPIHRSRETCGVWCLRGKAWKIFSSLDQFNHVKKEYDKAVKIGVPTPEFKFKQGSIIYENERHERKSREGGALVTDYIDSARSFSKDKYSNVTSAIHSTTDTRVLEKIELGLQKALKAKLRDAQGFIDPNNVDKPIMFIDIHFGSTESVALKDVLKVASARLNDIKSKS